MASLADLIKWRESLFEARLSSVRELQDQNGERVSYKSDSEMAAAIAAADQAIAEIQSGRFPNTILFRTSKGL
jgi:hypothetical protein